MAIFITIISILGLTLVIWVFNKVLSFTLCPICIGVSGTWFWIVAGMTAGLLEAESWKLIAALAMGGTAVGIAYQGERRYLWAQRHILPFRILVILGGFLFFYWSLENISWFTLGIETAVLSAILWLYFVKPYEGKTDSLPKQPTSSKVAALMEKLKSCCD